VDWHSKQNIDGGWAYSRGCSWTEPTAIVLLAQTAAGIEPESLRSGESFSAGIRFLRSLEAPDGGWRPQSGVVESTWVTALVGLLPMKAIGDQPHQRAIEWLKGRTGRESSWDYKLRQRLSGNKDEFPEGWPWFPGATAWVIPTTFAILAFERELRTRTDVHIENRIALGKKYLLSRMCADGGWNYGANRALGRDGDSYPETTGIALLALRGVKLDQPIAAARKHLANCRTAEGIAWLRMGLAAHGEVVPAPAEPVCRTTMDTALWALSLSPVNPLLNLPKTDPT
jgi:hypothetical protein